MDQFRNRIFDLQNQARVKAYLTSDIRPTVCILARNADHILRNEKDEKFLICINGVETIYRILTAGPCRD